MKKDAIKAWINYLDGKKNDKMFQVDFRNRSQKLQGLIHVWKHNVKYNEEQYYMSGYIVAKTKSINGASFARNLKTLMEKHPSFETYVLHILGGKSYSRVEPKIYYMVDMMIKENMKIDVASFLNDICFFDYNDRTIKTWGKEIWSDAAYTSIDKKSENI